MNLEIEKNMKSFCEFVRKVNPNTAEQTLDLLKSLRGELKVNPKQLYQLGKFLGTYINLYIKTLKDQGYDIDMVSCYFYHGTSKFSFLGRSEKTRRQFCIKNMTLLNSNIRNFKIYNNF